MEERKTVTALKKAAMMMGNVLFYIFLVICAFSVLFTIFSKKDVDGAAEIFGMQMRVIATDSMDKCNLTDVSAYKIKSLPPRTMVFIDKVPSIHQRAQDWYGSLRVGDVLTFRYVYTSQVTITHRITSITEKPDGSFIIQLTGDNKSAKTGQLTQTIDTSVKDSPNYVVGKVVGKSYGLGLFVSLLKSNVGLVCIVIVPCLLIAILEGMKLYELLAESKKQKAEARKEEQEEAQQAEKEEQTDGG